ncbi:MAG: GntR family transcriptional regulator [Sphaerochaetaceae bacterium]|nr:GntR family transcriptional regulator [Sphaerochaetaceae bacterium]
MYKKIFIDVKLDIENGKYLYGDMLPSEREFVEKYGVDRTTVRKAFELLVKENYVEKQPGKGSFVSYGGSSYDKEVKTTLGTIAFFLPKSNKNIDRITVPFYSQLFSVSEQTCKDNSYSIFYSTLEEQDSILEIMNQQKVRFVGILFVSNILEKHIIEANNLNIPNVLLNNVSSLTSSVISDNYSGSYMVATHLANLGHKSFCVLNGIEEYQTAKDRLRGVKEAFKDRNIDLNDIDIISDNSWEFEGGFSAVSKYLDSVKKLPTALIAFNDRLANGAIQAIQKKGLSVPDDISVVGFDNSDLSKYTTPKLSTVEINAPFLARVAFYNLLIQIKFQKNFPTKVLAPVNYIERDSVTSIT